MKILIIILTSICFVLIDSSLHGQSNWELARSRDGIKVWTMDFQDSEFKQFKSEITITTKLHALVALQLDVENMNKWYDKVGNVRLIEKISPYEGIYILEYDMPFPVPDRITSIRAKIDYDKKQKKVFINTRYEPNIIKNTDKVLVTSIQSSWEITQIDSATVHVIHWGFMDPNGSLPPWLVNSGVKNGPISSLKKMKEMLSHYKDSTISWLM